MRALLTALALACLATGPFAQSHAQTTTERKTEGGCSPIVDNTTGDVSIKLNCKFGTDPADSFDVELLRVTLACNSAEERRDVAEKRVVRGEPIGRAEKLFRRLQKLDDSFVYVDLSVWVGAGCGLNDVAAGPAPRWGVIYDLSRTLDGFPGNAKAYTYGYRIEYDGYQKDLANSRASTLLFPNQDGAFFSARFGKAMQLQGVAKIRLTDVQGFQIVEITPATPVGGLAQHYSRLRKYLKEKYR